MKILGHGPDDQVLKEKFGNKIGFYNSQLFILQSSTYIQKFPGDCGTLTMNGCSCLNDKTLEVIEQLIDTTGHDTIIGTVVGDYPEVLQAMAKRGWTFCSHGFSNRKGPKTMKTVVMWQNPNCTFKGYAGNNYHYGAPA